MREILIRADDLGYSRSVNYGIYDSVHLGIINNVGVMVNMPSTEMGLNLLKKESIDLGMHTNISNGKPISPVDQIPSLIGKNGYFRKSREYRLNAKKNGPDLVKLKDVVTEIDAQYQQFLKLVGRKPDYFEGHAILSPNFRRGLKIIANRYNLPFLDFPLSHTVSFKNHTQFLPFMGGYKDGKIDNNYNPFELLKKAVKRSGNNTIPMIISHAGYLDNYLLTHSSLTFPRVKEAAVWIDSKTKQYLQNNNVKLIRYSECK